MLRLLSQIAHSICRKMHWILYYHNILIYLISLVTVLLGISKCFIHLRIMFQLVSSLVVMKIFFQIKGVFLFIMYIFLEAVMLTQTLWPQESVTFRVALLLLFYHYLWTQDLEVLPYHFCSCFFLIPVNQFQ